jgi:hypothetical protein
VHKEPEATFILVAEYTYQMNAIHLVGTTQLGKLLITYRISGPQYYQNYAVMESQIYFYAQTEGASKK